MWKRRSLLKYFKVAILGAVLYCEWVVYQIQPLQWQKLQCADHDTSCTKILFIADPQIEGEDAVIPPWNFLFYWDSDRYLSSTYQVAISHFKPDIIVFLGDLMDEGSISSKVQFHRYAKRLSTIFDPGYHAAYVFIPGDNDIGGENEPIRQDKIKDFNALFDQPTDVVEIRNISFFKINAITHTIPKLEKDVVNSTNYKMVVSHYPVTNLHVFGNQVNSQIRPQIYFCAHDHQSKLVKQNKDLTHRETSHLDPGDGVLEVSRSDDYLYEVYVPTCSYRMGTSMIGYGAAVLENNNQNLRYTVFWSSGRFPFLFAYLFILVAFCLYALVYGIIWRCIMIVYQKWVKPSDVVRGGDKKPLLEGV